MSRTTKEELGVALKHGHTWTWAQTRAAAGLSIQGWEDHCHWLLPATFYMTAVWRRVKCQQINPGLSSKSCRLMRWIDGKESLKDNRPQCVSNVFFGGRLLRWKRIDWCPEVSCTSPWSLSLRLSVECQLWQLSSMFAQRYIIVINELSTREDSEGPDFRESTPDPLAGRRLDVHVVMTKWYSLYDFSSTQDSSWNQ